MKNKRRDLVADCIANAQKEVGEGRFNAMWFYLMVALIGAVREVAAAISGARDEDNEGRRGVDRSDDAGEATGRGRS